jgi:hypothetical protein
MHMTIAIENLLSAIHDSYVAYHGDLSSLPEASRLHRMKMIESFKNSLGATNGKKYIKIVKDGSVWGFVVSTTDDAMFRYGDILKAVSWASPARNGARGNVFEDYSVEWTGPASFR